MAEATAQVTVASSPIARVALSRVRAHDALAEDALHNKLLDLGDDRGFAVDRVVSVVTVAPADLLRCLAGNVRCGRLFRLGNRLSGVGIGPHCTDEPQHGLLVCADCLRHLIRGRIGMVDEVGGDLAWVVPSATLNRRLRVTASESRRITTVSPASASRCSASSVSPPPSFLSLIADSQ
jgi:hypothetical protein